MADLESSGKQHGDAAVTATTTATTEADLVPIPGTVHLVDLEGTMRAAHASCAGQEDVVLVPAPSADPDDPLNWTPRRKWMATVANGVYNLTIGIASAAVYSVLEPISRDTGLTVAQLNAGTGYMFLMFVSLISNPCGGGGWGPCMPGLADVIGRVAAADLKRGKRTVVLTHRVMCLVGVGVSLLAGRGVAVWQETRLSLLPAGDHGHHGLGAARHDEWCLDRQVHTCHLPIHLDSTLRMEEAFHPPLPEREALTRSADQGARCCRDS